ncbi:unnamed protein product [Polarella glacialis]|uniref:Mic1 domain-containing protein n=1 Tax=Polarella glacialis TaxID=89957 RepID=A0A813HGE3_POLGL|nr:unnamed protein product [Polarella glacialis]
MGQPRKSPLRLSEPIYRWEPGVSGEHVAYDELHHRVVHVRPGGFSTIDVVGAAGASTPAPDGLSVALDQEGLRSVRFSPDGMHFAFVCNKQCLGCLQTLRPGQQPIQPVSKWSSRPEFEVLGFFWLPPAGPSQGDPGCDLAVVTSQGLEVFRIVFEQRSAKSLKAFPATVRMCWLDPISATALVCTGPRTLQPFDLRARSPKLPRFDLVLSRGQSIEAGDVALMTIYDCTYCIHTDGASGRVSLRNISHPSQGTPEHDIVIDVAEDDGALGPLRLSQVDNLLVVHCVEKRLSTIFDIRHKEGAVVPCLCGPSSVSCGDDGEEEESAQSDWLGWDFLSGSTILDLYCGNVCQLQVDMGSVMKDFLAKSPHDLATVMRLLLRRTNCRDYVVQVIRQALDSKTRSAELNQAFAVLNSAYRQAIEAMSARSSAGVGTGRQGQATVILLELEAMISHQSILSEKDMVSQVFHPHFLELEGLAAEDLFREEVLLPATHSGSGSADSALLDKWRIPLEARAHRDKGKELLRAQGRCPEILSVVIGYLRSLLGLQILPHKILQCFVFDLCLYYRQEHTLQQLLHYHVLLDSTELVLRLRDLAINSASCAWATQSCLDMALRVREFAVVAEMLLFSRQYLDIVPFLVNQRDVSFKVRSLLERLDADAEAKEDDPELMDHVVSEIHLWQKEALLSAAAIGRASSESSAAGAATPHVQSTPVAPPDLEGCQKWLPELCYDSTDGGSGKEDGS